MRGRAGGLVLAGLLVAQASACGPAVVDYGSGAGGSGDTGIDGNDGGTPDGGMPDGGTPDGGTPDGGTPDGGTPDGGTPDGGTSDGGTSDRDGDGDGYTTAEGDCDDGDASIHPGASEERDLVDQDCDGLVDEDLVAVGDVLIDEVMVTPGAVEAAVGQWIELLNVSEADVDLVGWTLHSSSGEGIQVARSLVVPAGGLVVLATSADPELNGGVEVDLAYDPTRLLLDGATDSLSLSCDGREISSLSYATGWDLAAGASLSLDPQRRATDQVHLAESWCAATRVYGAGDRGTPGQDNDLCASVDHDGDGRSADEGDCDDLDPTVYPGAEEVFDLVDSDCDGTGDLLRASEADTIILGGARDFLGYRASVALGDLDGDGSLDLVVGGTYVNDDAAGGLYVLDGGDPWAWDGLVQERAAARVDGRGAYGYFGTVGARLGDQDGDGLDDLVASGVDWWYSGWYGQVAGGIFFGKDGGLESVESDEADVVFHDGRSVGPTTSVLSEADLDGDGLDEAVFGDWDDSGDGRGYVYIFAGHDLDDDSLDLQDDATVILYGDADDDHFGWSLAGADVDGDHLDDLFMSAPGADVSAEDGGCIYRVSGRSTLSGSASVSWAADLAICSATAGAELGRHGPLVLADFDGDGALDLAAGAPGAGRVLLFFGVADLLGDVEAESADLVIALDDPVAFGQALAAGDLDGDGLDDLVVSAPGGDALEDSPAESGSVLVFAGASLAAGVGTLDGRSADGRIDSSSAELLGAALSVGDLDGDARDDLVIAAPLHGEGQGRVLVFLMP